MIYIVHIIYISYIFICHIRKYLYLIYIYIYIYICICVSYTHHIYLYNIHKYIYIIYYIHIYRILYIYHRTLAYWLECSPMARETWLQSQSSHTKDTMVLDASLLNT